MKLLFVINTLTGGGAERALCNLTLALPAEITTDILVNSTSELDYPHRANVISLQMEGQNKKGLMYHFKVAINRIITLNNLKQKGNYDACISFMDSANILNVLTGKKYCKTILSVRNVLSKCDTMGYRFLIWPAAWLLYKHATVVTALSKGAELDLIKNFRVPPQKAVTIYNGYLFQNIQERAREVPEKIDFEKKSFYFLTVGRHTTQKGQQHLIRAFAKVYQKYPQCRLILLGQGERTGYFKKLAKDLEIEEVVLFPGFLKNPFSIAAHSDAFVFPSIFEGFGNVMIENMICGLPVIAADFRAGAREILAPDTDFRLEQTKDIEYAEYGLLTPVCSGKTYMAEDALEWQEKCLEKAMSLYVSDADLREHYREKAQERASHFSIEKTVQEWLKLC